MSIKFIVEDYLKGELWGSLKHTEQSKIATINVMKTYFILKMYLIQYLLDIAS